MDELLEQFLIEGPELVQQASDDLLALEREPGNADRLDSAFRAIHTLKGSVGLFDLPPMGLVLHAAEDLLGAVRAGERPLDRMVVDLLITAVSQTERWLLDLAGVGGLPESARPDAQALAARLRHGLGGETGSAQPDAPTAGEDAAWADSLSAQRPPQAPANLVAVRYAPSADSYFRGEDPIAIARAAPDILVFRVSVPETPPDGHAYDPFACRLTIELLSFAGLDALAAAFRLVSDQVSLVALPPPAAEVAEAVAPRVLRVDAARIDHIADLVDELVIAKNALGPLAGQILSGQDPAAAAAALAGHQASLDRLVGGLHRAVMGARRVPVTPLLRRFPRMVREMAAGLGKEAELEVDGGGLEMDKAAVDGLFEPLTHLLRNAVDHGVEAPGQRQRAGKSARAVLHLTARLQNDEAVIEVRDDGRGLNPDQIRRIARERGLLDAAALEALSDAEAVNLVFQPGFSTTDAVTELSGRGVGMDAVRAAVSRLGGIVALESELGAGTTVRLTLPQSLALTQVLVVICRGERYGVAVTSIAETTRVAADRIMPVRAGHAFVLRDRTVPLLDLAEMLGQPAGTACSERRVLILRAGDARIGIAVDAVVERLEVVVRPLSGLLARLPGVSGAALLGDGQVMLVLNLAELVG